MCLNVNILFACICICNITCACVRAWEEDTAVAITTCALQAEGYARKHLDISRYNKLKKDIERYRRYLYSDTIADEVKSKPA